MLNINRTFNMFEGTFIKDFLFPKFCLGCNRIGTYLCPKCQNKLEYFAYEDCLYCGRKSPYGLTHPGCLKEFGIDGFLSVFKYNRTLKQIIKAFKYRRAVAVWREFRLLIRPNILTNTKNWPKADFLQPIPLYKSRFNQRGFNQAEIITRYFNCFLKLEVSCLLLRKKETKPQAQITSKNQRRSNISQAFVLAQKTQICNKVVVLVDDLLTTGDTIKEAGKVLKKNGARLVFALTLARG